MKRKLLSILTVFALIISTLSVLTGCSGKTTTFELATYYITLETDKSTTIPIEKIPSGYTTNNLVYSIKSESSSGCIQGNGTGLFYGVKPGTAVITVSVSGRKDLSKDCTINVVNACQKCKYKSFSKTGEIKCQNTDSAISAVTFHNGQPYSLTWAQYLAQADLSPSSFKEKDLKTFQKYYLASFGSGISAADIDVVFDICLDYDRHVSINNLETYQTALGYLDMMSKLAEFSNFELFENAGAISDFLGYAAIAGDVYALAKDNSGTFDAIKIKEYMDLYKDVAGCIPVWGNVYSKIISSLTEPILYIYYYTDEQNQEIFEYVLEENFGDIFTIIHNEKDNTYEVVINKKNENEDPFAELLKPDKYNSIIDKMTASCKMKKEYAEKYLNHIILKEFSAEMESATGMKFEQIVDIYSK